MKKTSLVVNRGLGGKFKERKKSRAKELSITSLLDIMTILLVFMMKNVSMDVSQRNAPEGMILPSTISKDDLMKDSQLVYVKIFRDKILYGPDNMLVGSPQELLVDKGVQNILIDYLKKEAKYITKSNNKPSLLIQADKEVECKYISGFIKLSTKAAFADIYFSTIHSDNKEEILNL